MRKTFIYTLLVSLFLIVSQSMRAQDNVRPFEGKYYNEEYQVYLHLNFYDKDMEVSGQEYLGPLPGYFSAKRDTRLWMIVEAKLINESKAHTTFINDFGSEDFEADLTIGKDGSLTLKRLEGSTLKIVVNNKYVKLPKEVVFKRE